MDVLAPAAHCHATHRRCACGAFLEQAPGGTYTFLYSEENLASVAIPPLAVEVAKPTWPSRRRKPVPAPVPVEDNDAPSTSVPARRGGAMTSS